MNRHGNASAGTASCARRTSRRGARRSVLRLVRQAWRCARSRRAGHRHGGRPVRAIEAHMDGFTVLRWTGGQTRRHFRYRHGLRRCDLRASLPMMKDGAILSQCRPLRCGVNVAALREMAAEHYEARHNIEGYVLPNGKTLSCWRRDASWNPPPATAIRREIMDMSFAVQAMSAKYSPTARGASPRRHPRPARDRRRHRPQKALHARHHH